MRSLTVWKLAGRPNYNTNSDKQFPYSEVPFIGEYHLLKIPVALNGHIEHVDYWGEGKVVTGEGIRGFSNCYNVHHQYQLVSSGPDVDRKIPNRIPVNSDDNCDTSGYIKDNSVLTVTVAGAHINSSSAKDIARIVNNNGRVVVYGVHCDSQKISELAVELRKKGLICSSNGTLSSELQGLTYYNSHVSFFNAHTVLDETLYNAVVNGNYGTAVNTVKNVGLTSKDRYLDDIVTRLIGAAPRNVMIFAFILWHSSAEDTVRNHFPKAFQLIFNQDPVTIVNKQYQQPLKLDMDTDSCNDRLAWGDNDRCEITSHRLSWEFIPIWDGNSLTFKLYNIHRKMYLKLDVNADNIGDRQAWGSTNSDEVRHRYYLEPVIKNGILVFFIINCRYNQGLKLGTGTDRIGDRLLWGHNSNVHNEQYERFRWVIAAW